MCSVALAKLISIVPTDSLNLGKGHSDYMPPSVVTEALRQVASRSDPSVHQYTRSSV